MFTINGNDIYISQGDSAELHVTIVDAAGENYTPADDDMLILEVREQDSQNVAFRAFSAQSPIVISAKDTNRLSGKYDYRVVLRCADGVETTVLGSTPNYTPHFYVMEG